MMPKFLAILNTIQLHFYEIKYGGCSVFFRKILSVCNRTLSLLIIILSGPLVLIIVLLRPLVWLRFGVIDSQRIGHFTGEVEAYLCHRENEKLNHRIMDIVGCIEPVCNKQLLSMWKRVMRITPGWKLWKFFDKACIFWTRGEKHHARLYNVGSAYRLLSDTEPHLFFTNEEIQKGRELLNQLGIPPDASWICIHNRDAAYLEKSYPDNNWSYHNYRDFSIQSMMLASEELAERGYYVLRMGSIVAEKVKSLNPKIIDYSSSELQTDFADIYLGARCIAYIGSDSGIASVPLIFHKPFCYINYSLTLLKILLNQNRCYLFITKRLWHRGNNKLLSLREIFELGLTGASDSQLFEKAGVVWISNTSIEIYELAIELDERLNGRWLAESDDEALQYRFWATFARYSTDNVSFEHVKSRIGAVFLRKNIDLLDDIGSACFSKHRIKDYIYDA